MATAAGERNRWVVGGGDLVGQFADAGLLDEVIVSIAPVTLGAGAPLLPRRVELQLEEADGTATSSAPLLGRARTRLSQGVRMPDAPDRPPVIVHLIDGTYELFRHFYGIRRGKTGDPPFGAVKGVLGTVPQMIEGGATHIGVATDHVIESFRNDLWPGYKTGEGIEPALGPVPSAGGGARRRWASWSGRWSSSRPTTRWPPPRTSSRPPTPRVEKVCIWTPDKDLAQCVVGDRVVQMDRRSGQMRDAAGVLEKFGVTPMHIPDYLALVGDAADGYPGIPGIGAKTAAARLIRAPRPHRAVSRRRPRRQRRELALLFKQLATLRTDAPLFADVDELRWGGPTGAFGSLPAGIVDDALAGRVAALVDRVAR